MTADPVRVAAARALPSLAEYLVTAGLTEEEGVTYEPARTVATITDPAELVRWMDDEDPERARDRAKWATNLLTWAKWGWSPAPGIRVYRYPAQVVVKVSPATVAIRDRDSR